MRQFSSLSPEPRHYQEDHHSQYREQDCRNEASYQNAFQIEPAIFETYLPQAATFPPRSFNNDMTRGSALKQSLKT
jgi:predicted RNA-binding protein